MTGTCSRSPLTGTHVWSVEKDEPVRCAFCGTLAPSDAAERAEAMAADLKEYGREPRRGRTDSQVFAGFNKKKARKAS